MAALRKLRRQYLPFIPSGDAVRLQRAKMLRRFGLARTREPRLLVEQPSLRYGSVLPLAVADHVMRNDSLSFLQIGAFDGSQNDELQAIIDRYPVRGVLVEPQPNVFVRLAQLHSHIDHLTLVNAAIDQVAGSRPLYMSHRGDLECASFDRNHLLKHGVEPSEIYSRDVECLTVAGVLERAGLQSVDLLQIDAEGYDYEIIKTINFELLRPSILRFEYRHLSHHDLDQCLQLLADYQYRFIVEHLDLICLQD